MSSSSFSSTTFTLAEAASSSKIENGVTLCLYGVGEGSTSFNSDGFLSAGIPGILKTTFSSAFSYTDTMMKIVIISIMRREL